MAIVLRNLVHTLWTPKTRSLDSKIAQVLNPIGRLANNSSPIWGSHSHSLTDASGCKFLPWKSSKPGGCSVEICQNQGDIFPIEVAHDLRRRLLSAVIVWNPFSWGVPLSLGWANGRQVESDWIQELLSHWHPWYRHVDIIVFLSSSWLHERPFGWAYKYPGLSNLENTFSETSEGKL